MRSDFGVMCTNEGAWFFWSMIERDEPAVVRNKLNSFSKDDMLDCIAQK